MTIGEIAGRYERERLRIRDALRSGSMSGTMSNIELYPKPWPDLDMDNDADAWIVSVQLNLPTRDQAEIKQ